MKPQLVTAISPAPRPLASPARQRLRELHSERESLKRAVITLGQRAETASATVQSIVEENERLKAENTKLRRAPRGAVKDVIDRGKLLANAGQTELMLANVEREICDLAKSIADLARRFHGVGYQAGCGAAFGQPYQR